MSMAQAKNDLVTVNGYPEDVKTLLAFEPAADSAGTGLVGFTLKVRPQAQIVAMWTTTCV